MLYVWKHDDKPLPTDRELLIYLGGYSFPHFRGNGTWYEWTGNCDVESGDDNMTIDLPEYEAKVFVWQ